MLAWLIFAGPVTICAYTVATIIFLLFSSILVRVKASTILIDLTNLHIILITKCEVSEIEFFYLCSYGMYVIVHNLLFSKKQNTMEHICHRKIYDNYDGATVLC